MRHGICVSSRYVWKVYCGLAYTEAQETDNGGWTVTSTRRPSGDGTVYPLFAVKQERITKDVSRQPILKPVHPNVTALHQIFYHDAIISFVYEEMDMTLSQVLSLPLHSRMTHPAMRHRMIGAILKQVVHGVDYIHNQLRIAHGELCMSNVQMCRNGVIKLANVGRCILHPTTDYQSDFTALSKLFDEVVSSLEEKPSSTPYLTIRGQLLEGSFAEIQQVLAVNPFMHVPTLTADQHGLLQIARYTDISSLALFAASQEVFGQDSGRTDLRDILTNCKLAIKAIQLIEQAGILGQNGIAEE
ncbi:hypothetical protein B0A55_11078 [Friedmanniomyces simplex]|uniref:Protein kinase domain-containing protein n=1 Tax=Friedmanniomyces simplex TaxID=329884 RepID=A0A4U0WVJ1_9PEZI|nr:hypothetical protein B0A55_11078 [Friedmanniomyces simplex]